MIDNDRIFDGDAPNNVGRCEVAILAGGQGTRLKSVSGELPKPMVPLIGKPILEHQIELCRKHGFYEVAVLAQYKYQKIIEYFGDGKKFGVNLTYVIEQHPRGTAGALRDALPVLADRFLLLYGDTYIDVDLRRFWSAHASSGVDGTLFLHPNDHPHDSDLVEIDRHGVVKSILPYPHPPGREARNLVNAALYVLQRKGIVEATSDFGKADIAKQMFPQMLSQGRRLLGYVSPEYIKDVGTPERLAKVERDFASGLPERMSGRQLRSAVFLDRDGTLIEQINHLKSPDHLALLPGVGAAIRRLNHSGVLAVVVTNQPVVARGELTFDGLDKVHARLDWEIGKNGGFVDRLYYCPHHPDKGFAGEVDELKVVCCCRKPSTGLIDQACRELEVNRRDSWMIGDATSDVEAGRRAGLRTVLLTTGYAGADSKYAAKPDYIFPTLSDAVDWVLDGHANLSRLISPIVSASHGKRLVLIGGDAVGRRRRVAQVFKELLTTLGYVAHLISLDGCIDSSIDEMKIDDKESLKSRKIDSVREMISSFVNSAGRLHVSEPISWCSAGGDRGLILDHSIGIDDLVLIEGGTALVVGSLAGVHDAVKIWVSDDPVSPEKPAAAAGPCQPDNADFGGIIKPLTANVFVSPERCISREFVDFIVSENFVEALG
jgi:histidinol-phosphate phosphatase family protein